MEQQSVHLLLPGGKGTKNTPPERHQHQAIADAASSSVDLSAYCTSAQTDSLFYPRTELDSLLTATLTQYWTSGRTQTEIDDALAGSGSKPRAMPGIWCEPRARSRVRFSTWCRSSSRPALCGTYFLKPRWWATPSSATSPRSASEATPGPRPRRTPASCGRMIWVRWTPVTSQTPRAPRAAVFSIWFRPSSTQLRLLEQGPVGRALPPDRQLQLPGPACHGPGERPRSGFHGGPHGQQPPATSFVDTPLLQSAAADLHIRNATTTIRAEDGTLLASFATGSIGLEQDITVRADRTLNATTADFAQFFVGSTAATGTFASCGCRRRWCAATRRHHC